VTAARGPLSFRGHDDLERNTSIPRCGRWLQGQNRENTLFYRVFSQLSHSGYTRYLLKICNDSDRQEAGRIPPGWPRAGAGGGLWANGPGGPRPAAAAAMPFSLTLPAPPTGAGGDTTRAGSAATHHIALSGPRAPPMVTWGRSGPEGGHDARPARARCPGPMRAEPAAGMTRTRGGPAAGAGRHRTGRARGVRQPSSYRTAKCVRVSGSCRLQPGHPGRTGSYRRHRAGWKSFTGARPRAATSVFFFDRGSSSIMSGSPSPPRPSSPAASGRVGGVGTGRGRTVGPTGGRRGRRRPRPSGRGRRRRRSADGRQEAGRPSHGWPGRHDAGPGGAGTDARGLALSPLPTSAISTTMGRALISRRSEGAVGWAASARLSNWS
jgi:hypothetical protein